MLLDLAAWVDQKGSGTIKYMDFIDAFQILDDVEHSVRGGPEAGDEVSSAQEALGLGAVSQLMEQLCSLFFQHRWSMQRAFEYFDANGDGSLTPEEYAGPTFSILVGRRDPTVSPTFIICSSRCLCNIELDCLSLLAHESQWPGPRLDPTPDSALRLQRSPRCPRELWMVSVSSSPTSRSIT
eukprot:scaffold34310_cov31-Tisochrysis_lutea.AAC.5